MKDNTLKILSAIAGIIILDAMALTKGIDGILYSSSIALIAGLAGYTIGEIKGAL